MGSEARLLLRAPLGVVEVEQKRPLNHVGERLRTSLAEEALQDGEDALQDAARNGRVAAISVSLKKVRHSTILYSAQGGTISAQGGTILGF
jgi:hypothetical protein